MKWPLGTPEVKDRPQREGCRAPHVAGTGRYCAPASETRVRRVRGSVAPQSCNAYRCVHPAVRDCASRIVASAQACNVYHRRLLRGVLPHRARDMERNGSDENLMLLYTLVSLSTPAATTHGYTTDWLIGAACLFSLASAPLLSAHPVLELPGRTSNRFTPPPPVVCV